MHINRLRLLGFKSFVEPTELVIETGLTGVVGPNGCGKSNLLEALRWVMGETSHKSMHAAAMDDVIFSGTQTRPARNTAEVTIFIDNSGRQAPSEFNAHDTLEVTRRIEREAGSAFRINGREVRARDVRILFEDAATGARSPALVRQGQIGELVNAKPEQRRRILEDAAGIAGLHSRRHEAELRLKAAEGNLARINDILGQLNSQIESLKRQARQARRYKEMAGEATLIAEAKGTLERLEAEIASLANTARLAADFEQKALAAHDQAETALGVAETRLSELTTAAAEARARRQSLETQKRERLDRVAKLERQLVALEAQTREIVGRAPDASKLKAATELGQQLMAEIAGIEAETLAAEEAVQATAAEAKAKSDTAVEAGLAAGQLKTEVETLAKLLTPVGDSGLPPILDQIKVEAGYEMALAAALGDDLDSPIAPEAPTHWRLNPPAEPAPALPSGVEPLVAHVAGPPALTRRLRQIGVVHATDGAP